MEIEEIHPVENVSDRNDQMMQSIERIVAAAKARGDKSPSETPKVLGFDETQGSSFSRLA